MPHIEQRLQIEDYRDLIYGCRYLDYHITLGTDGWQHATIYHHMIQQAQQARWTMIMPDITTTIDGEQIPLMMSQPIITCPLAVRPAPVGRQWGFVAMAVAAHQCGNDWLKEQQ